ncbi:ATP-dependent sacrificial sulfur transferase LarE [Ectobacillus polymachus]|uniref:ATP-dependent sacrificial sulfur transferase LarE n=1 Tax=Ectobacillus polymachus TaxID=1508806 RepID=UPI003A8BAC31
MAIEEMDAQEKKLQQLKHIIKGYEKLAIAFSGGVDSTFLAKVAQEVLGDNAMVITVQAPTLKNEELDDIIDFHQETGMKHEIFQLNQFNIKEFRENVPLRCYFCKTGVFENILKTAKKYGIHTVADGTNMDDLKDYRPGLKALGELGIVSPLKDAGLTKNDIRYFSKQYGLKTWNKPSSGCLATRIPYGEEITQEKLDRIDAAEKVLAKLGLKQLRVRYHDNQMARIEVSPKDREKFFDMKLMDTISAQFRQIGFTYTTLDMSGYRSGSLNEVLNEQQTQVAEHESK